MPYQVELDIYRGPLDLLLYLIEKEEVDIYDIPISRILEKYLEHLDQVPSLDINLAAEFLVMASTLMEIKSRMLLPVEDRAEEAQDEDDPRGELVRQLLAFRAFKEAAGNLGEMQEIRARRYGRGYQIKLPGDDKPAEPEPLKDASLFDLGSRYAALVKQTLGDGPRTIVYDEMSMEDRVAAITAVLAQRDEFALGALFEGRKTVYDRVGTFFALLEMVRDRIVRIYQNHEFGEILVKRYVPMSEDAPDPVGTYVEPHLPQPEELPVEGEGRAWRMRRQPQFSAFMKPDDDDEEAKNAEDPEVRLNRRIDEILARAEEISVRFEKSRAGRLRGEEDVDQDGAKGLEDALAAFDGEIGPLPPDEGAVSEAGGEESAPGRSVEGGSDDERAAPDEDVRLDASPPEADAG
jgi:segregation and condensation protein A